MGVVGKVTPVWFSQADLQVSQLYLQPSVNEKESRSTVTARAEKHWTRSQEIQCQAVSGPENSGRSLVIPGPALAPTK